MDNQTATMMQSLIDAINNLARSFEEGETGAVGGSSSSGQDEKATKSGEKKAGATSSSVGALGGAAMSIAGGAAASMATRAAAPYMGGVMDLISQQTRPQADLLQGTLIQKEALARSKDAVLGLSVQKGNRLSNQDIDEVLRRESRRDQIKAEMLKRVDDRWNQEVSPLAQTKKAFQENTKEMVGYSAKKYMELWLNPFSAFSGEDKTDLVRKKQNDATKDGVVTESR